MRSVSGRALLTHSGENSRWRWFRKHLELSSETVAWMLQTCYLAAATKMLTCVGWQDMDIRAERMTTFGSFAHECGHSSVGTFATWVLVAFLLVGGVAGAGDVESAIFEDGTRRRGEEYRLARDLLVRRGPRLIAFLQQKATSEDWHERVFAEILIARIQRPQDVARCDETLGKLVEAQQVREAVNKYPEPEWDKLPPNAADVPASHVVDVLWETAGSQANLGQRSRPTAAAIQFYLSPESDAVEAVIEVLAVEHNLQHLARKGLLKLGAATVPRMRQVLRETEPPGRRSTKLTPEEREQKQRERMNRARSLLGCLPVRATPNRPVDRPDA